jgi:hypothetical protein
MITNDVRVALGAHVTYLPAPEPPSKENSLYVGDGVYIKAENSIDSALVTENCYEWTIWTEREENGMNWITLGRHEMDALIRVYNQTKGKPCS